VDKQAWLKWRREGIGASDAPSIMGVSPWKTLNQLWKEKVLGEKQEENAAMKRGNEIEPIAFDFFVAESGIFLESQRCFEHPERNWMRATTDGINESEKVLVEIKSCRELHDEVPKHYYPQLQHQMEVVGYDKMFYVSHNGLEGKILEVEKDPEYVKELIKKEEEFWEKVQNGAKDMSGDENWIHIKERLQVIRDAKEELKEEESFLLSQAILFSDGVPACGEGIVLSKKTRKGSIQYAKIPELLGSDLERFRKPDVQYWSLELQK
jgi:putative phage-type endonuclease